MSVIMINVNLLKSQLKNKEHKIRLKNLAEMKKADIAILIIDK